MSDIDSLTAQMQALKAQLQQERLYFQQLINHFPAVIYFRDVNGHFTLVNRNHARILNCDEYFFIIVYGVHATTCVLSPDTKDAVA